MKNLVCKKGYKCPIKINNKTLGSNGYWNNIKTEKLGR